MNKDLFRPLHMQGNSKDNSQEDRIETVHAIDGEESGDEADGLSSKIVSIGQQDYGNSIFLLKL
jgi:hypothetical protein